MAVRRGKKYTESIRQDPFVLKLLSQLPADVKHSFSDEQLQAIRQAMGSPSWATHSIDIRGSVRYFRWGFYYVVLAGKNRRRLSRLDHEEKFSQFIHAWLLLILFGSLTTLSLLAFYLMKSALGVDIFPNFSLGIW